MAQLESRFSIEDEVQFTPMCKQANKKGISQEVREGKINSIIFTRMKVFYDILDYYSGDIFKKVDSSYVYPHGKPVKISDTEVEAKA